LKIRNFSRLSFLRDGRSPEASPLISERGLID